MTPTSVDEREPAFYYDNFVAMDQRVKSTTLWYFVMVIIFTDVWLSCTLVKNGNHVFQQQSWIDLRVCVCHDDHTSTEKFRCSYICKNHNKAIQSNFVKLHVHTSFRQYCSYSKSDSWNFQIYFKIIEIFLLPVECGDTEYSEFLFSKWK